MSFSSTSSKESSSVGASFNNTNPSNGIVLHSSLSEPGKNEYNPFIILILLY
jgi:hypothetical protein